MYQTAHGKLHCSELTYLLSRFGGGERGYCRQSSVDNLEQIKKSPREMHMVAVRMIEDDVYDKDRHSAC